MYIHVYAAGVYVWLCPFVLCLKMALPVDLSAAYSESLYVAKNRFQVRSSRSSVILLSEASY